MADLVFDWFGFGQTSKTIVMELFSRRRSQSYNIHRENIAYAFRWAFKYILVSVPSSGHILY